MNGLTRNLSLLSFALASMRRRWLRHLSVGLVYVWTVFLFASVLFLAGSLRNRVRQSLEAAPTLIVQRLELGRHALVDGEDLAKLRGIRGARRSQGRLWGYVFDPFVKVTYTVQVPPADFDPPLKPGETILGEAVARSKKVQEGQNFMTVSAQGGTAFATIREILPASTSLFSADLVLLSEPDFRKLFRLDEGLFTDLTLKVRNPKEIEKVREKIQARLPGFRVVAQKDLARAYDLAFDLKQGYLFFALAGGLFSFFLLVFEKASGLHPQEAREIGVLRGVGWGTADVLRVKAFEALSLSLIASGLGIFLAYLACFGGLAPRFLSLLGGWSELMPAWYPIPEFGALELISLLAFTVLPYFAAVLVPSWRAAASDPDALLRGAA